MLKLCAKFDAFAFQDKIGHLFSLQKEFFKSKCVKKVPKNVYDLF